MSAIAVGRRYARALLSLAKESGELSKVKTDMRELAQAWESSDELRTLFENPKVSSEARKAVLTALAAKMGLSSVVLRTLKLLSDRRRMRALPEIASAFAALADDTAGQLRADVSTAIPMPDAYFDELTRVLEKATGRKIALVKKVDPSLIGGVVARVGDRVFDGSIRNGLGELKDSLLLN